MKHDQKIDIVGRIGEKIVVNYLNSQGEKVQESIDHFDREKDLISNGKKVEVKTQQPFVVKNAFTFRVNQLRKCRSVDELYIVSVPPKMKPNYKWGGWLFKVDPKTFKESRYTTSFGNEMVVINIEQPAVTPLKKLSKEEIDELNKYTESAYT